MVIFSFVIILDLEYLTQSFRLESISSNGYQHILHDLPFLRIVISVQWLLPLALKPLE